MPRARGVRLPPQTAAGRPLIQSHPGTTSSRLCVSASCDLAKTSDAAASSTTSPRCIIATRSAISATTPKLTVMNRTDLPRLRFGSLMRYKALISVKETENPAAAGSEDGFEMGVWRTVRDSNPRDGSPPTHFPGVRLRPLGQLSVRRGIAQGHAQAQGKSVMPAPMLSCFTFFALRSCISPQPAHFCECD
jgi:hypothetical protein